MLVYRLDRLGRSLRALLAAHDALAAAGVAIRSATEPFDTQSPIGAFLFSLLASLAELERATIAERTTLGRVRVARDGRYAGGPIPFGYDLDPDRRLIPSARPVPGVGLSEAELVRDLFHRIANGSSLHAEAARMNALGVPSIKRYAASRKRGTPETELRIAPRWTPARVWAIIHNPIYKGQGFYRARTGAVPVPAPALVDAATWERAGQQLVHNRRAATRNAKHPYLLRLLITCGHCGLHYTGRAGRPRRQRSSRSAGSPGPSPTTSATSSSPTTSSATTSPGSPGLSPGSSGSPSPSSSPASADATAGRAALTPTRWYACNGAGRTTHGAGKGCPGQAIDADVIEELVWQDIRRFIAHPGQALADAQRAAQARARQGADLATRQQALAERRAALEQERERVRTLYRRGAISLAEAEADLRALAQEADQLAALLQSLTAQAALAQAEAAQLASAEALLAQLGAELAHVEATNDLAAKRQIIQLLVAGITVTTEGRGRAATVTAHVRYTFTPTDAHYTLRPGASPGPAATGPAGTGAAGGTWATTAPAPTPTQDDASVLGRE